MNAVIKITDPIIRTLEELDRAAFAMIQAGTPVEEAREWFANETRRYRIKKSIEVLKGINDE